MIYRDALGLPVETVTGYKVGERCVLLPQDFRAYRAIRRADGLSFVSWVRSWIGATPSIFQRSDPAAGARPARSSPCGGGGARRP